MARGPARGRSSPGSTRRRRRPGRRRSPGVEAWLAETRPAQPPSSSPAPTVTGKLNRAVALLYAGEALTAERELLALRGREPRWVPALRWLARAQERTGDPATDATIEALLAHTEPTAATSCGRVSGSSKPGRPTGRRGACARRWPGSPDLYLGWLWLGDAEAARGRDREAREAWLRARALHAGGDLLFVSGRAACVLDDGRRAGPSSRRPWPHRKEGSAKRRSAGWCRTCPPVPPASPVTPAPRPRRAPPLHRPLPLLPLRDARDGEPGLHGVPGEPGGPHRLHRADPTPASPSSPSTADSRA